MPASTSSFAPSSASSGSLPRPQRRAIEAAFRFSAAPPPDPFLIALATLELLSMAARPGLVIVVEDAQWLDRRTSEVLTFVARRVSSDPIVLLVTARDDRRSPILEAGLDELCLEEFSDDDQAARPAAGVSPSIASSGEQGLLDLGAGNPVVPVVMQVWDDIHLGRWTEAASEIEAATELAHETGDMTSSVVADVATALLAAMRGDESEVESTLAHAGSAALAVGRAGWVRHRGRPWDQRPLCRARRRRVRPLARSAHRLREREPVAIDHFADAAVLTGNVEEGRAVLAACGDPAEAGLGPLQAAGLIYGGALLADDATADERQTAAIAD